MFVSYVCDSCNVWYTDPGITHSLHENQFSAIVDQSSVALWIIVMDPLDSNPNARKNGFEQTVRAAIHIG